MRKLIWLFALVLTLAVLAAGCSSESTRESEDQEAPAAEAQAEKEKQFLAFGGGPTGGTFNFFANKMSSLISNTYDWLDVSPKGSGGSAENLRTLDKHSVDLGIVYSGDAFLGRNGKLPNDDKTYTNVRGMSFLYGAPAQLVVRADSGITSAKQLEGKAVAVGNPGSGAALSAERFFRHMGLWDKMDHRNLGYSQAAADFSDNKIDAFWVLVGYPNSSIIEAATRTDIALVDVDKDAKESGFYDEYPFYNPVDIPAGTYDGVDKATNTFQDSSLWCANKDVSEDTVYDCLSVVYSEKGLKDMVTAHKAAKSMSIENGIKGVSIPLHPGAIKFWTEKGLTIPDNLK